MAGDGSLWRLLDSLPASAEVLIADRTNRLERLHEYPQCRAISVEADCGIPQMRARALAEAQGAIVVVVEDHCVAPPGWLDALTAPLSEEGVVAVAGPVSDGLRGGVSDQAAFLCDYAPYLPHADAPRSLPGMNTAYRASALRAVLEAAGSEGFWEQDAHPALARLGELRYAPSAALLHCKAFPLPLGLQQRFFQGRHHAGRRLLGRPLLRRGAYLAVTPMLPWLLTARTLGAVWSRTGPSPGLIGALPAIVLLHVAGAAGEAVATVAGQGHALRRLV